MDREYCGTVPGREYSSVYEIQFSRNMGKAVDAGVPETAYS